MLRRKFASLKGSCDPYNSMCNGTTMTLMVLSTRGDSEEGREERCNSDVEAEVHDVAFLHHVLFAFEPRRPCSRAAAREPARMRSS